MNSITPSMKALNPDSKFSLSLTKLVMIIATTIALAFGGGSAYESLDSNKDLQKQHTKVIGEITLNMAKMTSILDNVSEKQGKSVSDIENIQEDIHELDADIKVISNDIKDLKSKYRRHKL